MIDRNLVWVGLTEPNKYFNVYQDEAGVYWCGNTHGLAKCTDAQFFRYDPAKSNVVLE